MIFYLTVTAKNKETGEETVYSKVYDMAHLYGYNVAAKYEHTCLRLLIGTPYETVSRREYIDLVKNDVSIRYEEGGT